MSLAATFAERGVLIVEYALTASDVDRIAGHFPHVQPPSRQPAPCQLATWLSTHPVLVDLTGELTNAAAHLATASIVHHIAHQPWRTGWQPASNLATYPATDLLLAIALDAFGAEDGPLEVRLGSHAADQQPEAQFETAICLLDPGDILVLHPSVQLRTQRGLSPRGRRFVQLDYTVEAAAQRSIRTGPSPGHA